MSASGLHATDKTSFVDILLARDDLGGEPDEAVWKARVRERGSEPEPGRDEGGIFFRARPEMCVVETRSHEKPLEFAGFANRAYAAFVLQ